MEQVGRTGLVAVHMVGDNKVYFEQVSNLVPLKDEDYCQSCGQVGCGHTNV
jgi:hypothetical protein